MKADADHDGYRISVFHAMHEWWTFNRSREGFFPTVLQLAAGLGELLLDLIPERRRRRYGDVEYDWDNRVDTTSATVSLRNRVLAIFHSPYQATEPDLFREMVGGLNIDYSRFVFIDLGSGKGRALLMASEYPFVRIIGVELLPELHAAAQENIRIYRNQHQKCFQLESVRADARDYDFPAEPLVVYLFNPFPRPTLAAVLTRLESAIREVPRPVYLLYHNPLLADVLAGSSLFQKIAATHQYAIYSSTI